MQDNSNQKQLTIFETPLSISCVIVVVTNADAETNEEIPEEITKAETPEETTEAETNTNVDSGTCIEKGSLPSCSKCLESAQCVEGFYCCPKIKKCLSKDGHTKCPKAWAMCIPPCDTVQCSTCTPTNGATYGPEGWQKSTCCEYR